MNDLERELRDLFLRRQADLVGRGVAPPPGIAGRTHRRQARTMVVVVLVVAVVSVAGIAGTGALRRSTNRPADIGPSPTPAATQDGQPPLRFDWASIPTVRSERDAIVDVRTGDVTPLPAGLASNRTLANYAVAPGGRSLLFEADAGGPSGNQIFVAKVNGSHVRQLTDAPGGATAGAWSPDGTKIVAWFGSDGSDNRRIVDITLVDVVTGETTVLASGRAFDFYSPHFGADGRQILFSRFTKPEGSDLFGVPVTGGDVRLVWEKRWDAIFSPDGQGILYEVSVMLSLVPSTPTYWSGQELWLADADGNHERPLVWEEAYNDTPSWSPDGRRIAYSRQHIDEPERIVVVDVHDGTPTFSVFTGQPSHAVWLDDDTVLVDVEG
jgi:dipeptidyl aminopeptidase/acylaminoacyl peptidase